MAAENDYDKTLQEISEKIDNINTFCDIDILSIKSSLEQIEEQIKKPQDKVDFEEIKDKIEILSTNIEGCNETVLKDLCNHISDVKKSTGEIGTFLENLQNVQNLALTRAEFDEYQKQQLDLALKTNETIYSQLEKIKENTNIVDNSVNFKEMQTQLSNINDALTAYMRQMAYKIASIPKLDEISSIVSDLNSVQERNIKQSANLIKELQANFSQYANDFKYKEIQEEIAKIGQIYEYLIIIENWTKKAGDINASLDNIYARLGQSIDFDDVAEKIDLIYENIDILNIWTQKIDLLSNTSEAIIEKTDKLETISEDIKAFSVEYEKINEIEKVSDNLEILSSQIEKMEKSERLERIEQTQSKILALTSSLDEIKNIKNVINFLNDNVINLDLEDISIKIDLIYENITAFNDWANKVDVISEQLSDFSEKFDDEDISLKIDIIYENIELLNKWVDKIDNLSKHSIEIENKVNKISKDLSALNDMAIKIEKIAGYSVEINYQVGEINQNLSLLNEWGNKVEDLALYCNEIDAKSNEIISKLENNFANINNLETKLDDIDEKVDEVPNIKDKLSDLSKSLNTIIYSTKDNDDSYIYTLLDIESDFLKLQKRLDDKSDATVKYVDSLKEKFTELNDDITSVSIRTNKLLLSADDTNQEFKKCLNSFKKVVEELETQKIYYDSTQEHNLSLETKLSNLVNSMNDCLNTGKNMNNAFVILAQWIDSTDLTLNSISNDIDNINKNIQSNIENIEIPHYEEEISEIKSLLTGIMVQLNTIGNFSNLNALEEKILEIQTTVDNINQNKNQDTNENDVCIDLITKQNELTQEINNQNEIINRQHELIKIQSLEINKQSEKIENLENKIDLLSSKFEQFFENNISNDNSNKLQEVIDIIKMQSNSANTIAQKIQDFDTNIGKIVSYIEED